MLGETTPGKGGASKMLIPLPLLGFLPQSPPFLLPHPPWGTVQLFCVSMMLHRTEMNQSCAGNRGKEFGRLVPPKRGESVEKRAREKTAGRGENKQLAALSPLSRRLSLAQQQMGIAYSPGLSPQDKGKPVQRDPALLNKWSNAKENSSTTRAGGGTFCFNLRRKERKYAA